MAGYMVVGVYDCPWMAKACILVDKLTEIDPTRKFTTIMKDSFQWQEFQEELSIRRGWDIQHSPVIWEILVEPEGKGNLIGGIDAFCEYAELVFGLQLHVSTREIEEAVCRNKASYGKDAAAQNQQNWEGNVVNIAIIEPPLNILQLLLTQLLSPFPIWDSNMSLNIRIYDKKTPLRELQGLFMEVSDMAAPRLRKISSSLSPKQCMYNAHVALIMDDFSRDVHESTSMWLRRIAKVSKVYAQAVHLAAAVNCKVLIASSTGPLCYIAEIFRRSIPKKKIADGFIATLGQHIVNRAKAEISREAELPPGSISRLHAWGWPGLTGAWVEVRDALVRTSAVQGPRPLLRPLAEVATNCHWIFNKFSKIHLSIQRKLLADQSRRMYTDMGIAEAIISTLHVWFAFKGAIQQEEQLTERKRIKCRSGCVGPEKDEQEATVTIPVISVGIPCARKWGLPPGTFMVQPGMCYRGHWIPTGDISQNTAVVIHQVLAKLWTARQYLLRSADTHQGGLRTGQPHMIHEMLGEGKWETEREGEEGGESDKRWMRNQISRRDISRRRNELTSFDETD